MITAQRGYILVVVICAVALAVSALARAEQTLLQQSQLQHYPSPHIVVAPPRDVTLVLNLRQGLATSSMIVGGMSTQACEREALRWIAHGTAPGVSTAFAHCVNSND